MTAPSLLHLRQTCRASFRALRSEQSAVLLVRKGLKRVRGSDGAVEIGAGYMGVLPAHRALTIENCPPVRGCYLAQAISLPGDLLDRMRQDGLPPGDPFHSTAEDRILSAFEQAAIRLEDPLTPPRLRDHAVREVLLWLAEEGIGFGPPQPPSFADRLRGLFTTAPDQPWRAIDATRALAVSEATLRRRLAEEGTSFQDVLIDTRMIWALGLLQTSSLPVNRVALEVGYASPSRFAIRFRARFGISPSDIRETERIGTELERRGTAELPTAR